MACQMPIHVKLGDTAYGVHAIGKKTLILIIQWLRRSPIGRINGRTLVRYRIHQWRSQYKKESSGKPLTFFIFFFIKMTILRIAGNYSSGKSDPFESFFIAG